MYGTATPIDKNDRISHRYTTTTEIPLTKLNNVYSSASGGIGKSNSNGKLNRKHQIQQQQKFNLSATNTSRKYHRPGGKSNKPNYNSNQGKQQSTNTNPIWNGKIDSKLNSNGSGSKEGGNSNTNGGGYMRNPQLKGNKKNKKIINSSSRISNDGIAVKAPKQVKEHGFKATTTTATAITLNPFSNISYSTPILNTSNIKLTNLFRHYQKIEEIYPEFHPYIGARDPSVSSSLSSVQTSSGHTRITSQTNVKQSRKNSKIIANKNRHQLSTTTAATIPNADVEIIKPSISIQNPIKNGKLLLKDNSEKG